MAVPVNTVQTFAMSGIREDLSDVITNIAPYDTPFYSMTRKGRAKNRTPEWQNDALAPSNPDNKAVEGSDVTPETTGQPARLKNIVQLMEKVVSVSSTAQAVTTAGRRSERAYQIMKKGKELKRDMEARLVGNFASVLGGASTPGELAGAEAWLTTNVDRGDSGTSGGFNPGTGLVAAATDGDPRPVSEQQVKDVIRTLWENGGDGTLIMANGADKQAISGFAGIATQYRQNTGTRKGTILGAADVYISDFGTHHVRPNRFMGAGAGRTRITGHKQGLYPAKTVLVLTPRTWQTKFLQPFKTEPLAKTGHNTKRMMSAEFTLCCTDESANGAVADTGG